MNYWKVILATVVIFGAGVLTGGLLVNHVVHEHHQLARPRSPEAWRREFVGHLDKALKLTPEQRAEISRIVAVGQKKNSDIWHQQMAQVRQRIAAQLTPEQQKKFAEMVKRFAAHHSLHEPKPPRPPSTNHPPPPEGGATGP